MVETNKNQINIDIQFARDYLSASADASKTAESKFRKLFEKVVVRGIESAEKDNPSSQDFYFSRNVYFVPSDDERESLIRLYLEWKAYDEIHHEKVDEYEYIVKHKKKLDRNEIYFSKIKNEIWQLALKIIFYPTLLIAAIIIIKNSF